MRRISLSLCITASLSVILQADECKLWNYASHLVSAQVSDFGVGFKTQGQCDESQAKFEQSLRRDLDEKSQWSQKVRQDQMRHPTTDIKELGRQLDARNSAEAAEAKARLAWMDLPRCTCSARGETELEKSSREAREAARPKVNSSQTPAQAKQDEESKARDAAADRQSRLDAAREEREARLNALRAQLIALEIQRRLAFDSEIAAAQDEDARHRLTVERDAALANTARERAAVQDLLAKMKGGSPFKSAQPEIRPSSGQDHRKSQGQDLLSEMKSSSPFGDSPSATRSNPSQAISSASKEQAASTAANVFEEAAKRSAETLAEDARVVAKRLPKAKAAEYMREANDVTSFYKGFATLFKHYDTALGIGKIVSAETDNDRALGTRDLEAKLAQDAAEGGAAWAVKLLPKRVAAVLAGPVAWGGGILLGTETTAAEPADVLQRPKAFTTEEKKETLYRQIQVFSKYGSTWSPVQVQELVRLTSLVRETSDAQ